MSVRSTRTGDWERVARDRARALHQNLASLRAWVDTADIDGPADRAEADAVFDLLAKRSHEALDEITFKDLPLARLIDRSDILMHIEGDAATLHGEVRAAQVSKFLFNIQQSFARVVREIMRELTTPLRDVTELSFVGSAPGSLYLGFAIPDQADRGELAFPGEPAASVIAADVMRYLSEGSAVVARDGELDQLVEMLPDPRVRDAVLSSVHQLAPRQGTGVSLVEITGREALRATFLPKARQTSGLLLKATSARAHTPAAFAGVVREIDLDEKRFDLRSIETIGTLRCAYGDIDDATAMRWMNKLVRVRGMAENDRSGRPALMWTTTVDVVDTGDA